ncbi:MAG TPA: copper resistance protein CopC, partial [Longimicrobium sp.]
MLNRMIPGRRALLFAAAVACALLPSPGAAHTRVERSAPADGGTARDVREVRIHFTRSVESELTRISLYRAGTLVAQGGSVVQGTEAREYLLPLPRPLDPGAYEARWKTVGGDGHVLEGVIRFVVAADPAAAAQDTTQPVPAGLVQAAQPPPPADDGAGASEAVGEAGRPAAVAVRWTWFASLLAMIGVVAFRYGVLPRLDRDPEHHAVAQRAEHAVWLIALGAAALSVGALMLRLYLQASALGGDAW